MLVEYLNHARRKKLGGNRIKNVRGGRMHGFKAQPRHSIRLRRSLWSTAAILSMAIAAGVFSFVGAYNEAQDDVLRQIEALLRQRRSALLDMAGAADADP